MIRVLANILIVVIGLSTGAAIVHGMVYQQCSAKQEVFEAGIVPSDVKVPTQQQNSAQPADVPQCFQVDDSAFEAGVLPSDSETDQQNEPSLAGSPSVQGATPIQQTQAQISNQPTTDQHQVNPQTHAPAPSSAPAQPAPKPATTPPAVPAKTPAKPATPAKKTTKTVSLDLDKLSMAVAMTETHNCQDKVGSALYNNCHGFKKNGQFLHFNSIQASHDYFKQLWAKSYKIFPTYRLAQIYSGNDHPDTWLKNVTYYYNNL